MRPFPSILAMLLVTVGGLAPARANDHQGKFPEVIQLPIGFRPEGITHDGKRLFVANFDHGAVFEADIRTGAGHILVPAIEGRQGLGIKLDHRNGHLFVAGGATGHAYVYDEESGQSLADYTPADPADGPTFINDLLIFDNTVYFTDSFRPTLYRLPLRRHGRLPPPSAVEALPITGEFEFVPGPGNFNNNGIERTPDGKALIVINSKTGKLYRIDPDTAVSDQIDLAGGATLPTGDGLVLRGHHLFVVQNTNNIGVVHLEGRNRGRVVDNIGDPDDLFHTLATATRIGDFLYVTNARFADVPDPTGQTFTVVRVSIDGE